MSTDIASTVASVAGEADTTRDDEYPAGTTGTRRNRAQTKMLSVRLPVNDFNELERIADKLEVPVSLLVRGYILRGLSEHTESVSQTIQRVANEVEKLQKMVGREA